MLAGRFDSTGESIPLRLEEDALRRLIQETERGLFATISALPVPTVLQKPQNVQISFAVTDREMRTNTSSPGSGLKQRS